MARFGNVWSGGVGQGREWLMNLVWNGRVRVG